jgi:hypothetical protein
MEVRRKQISAVSPFLQLWPAGDSTIGRAGVRCLPYPGSDLKET